MNTASDHLVQHFASLVSEAPSFTPSSKGDAVLIASPPEVSPDDARSTLDAMRRNGTIYDYSHAIDYDSERGPLSIYCVIRESNPGSSSGSQGAL